jgi:Stage II sporulation protein E (SpoIIE)
LPIVASIERVDDPDSALARACAQLLAQSDSDDPDRLVETLSSILAGIGVTRTVLYLIDPDHATLHPLGGAPGIRSEPVVGSMPGRAFATQAPISAATSDGVQVWVPVSHFGDRQGVLALALSAAAPPGDEGMSFLGRLIGLLVDKADRLTDRYLTRRRHREMSLSAEIQWATLPPLSFDGRFCKVAGIVDPAYDVGGDCFDYSLNDDVLDLVITDPMGHDLSAAVLGSVAIASYRNERRAGHDLVARREAMHAAVGRHAGASSFVTALLAELDLRTGILTWISAGHPAPLVGRGTTVLDEPDYVPDPPLGVDGPRGPASVTVLEPGDRILLFTDGVTEGAAPETGQRFGEARLRDLFARSTEPELTGSEHIRRLLRASREFAGNVLQDDATLLTVTWKSAAT